MTVSIREFFEHADAEWKFQDISTLTVTQFKARITVDGSRTVVQLDDPGRTTQRFFVTGLEATDTELGITSVQLANDIQKVDPPLIITTDTRRQEHVASLVKAVQIGADLPPFDGTVTRKDLVEISPPAAADKVWQWRFSIESRGRARTKVVTADFQLQSKLGITQMVGQVYGVFFKYVRFFGAEPPIRPAKPAAAAPHPAPVHRVGHHAGSGFVPPEPFQDWRSKTEKAIWDLEYYEERVNERGGKDHANDFEKQQLARLEKLRKELSAEDSRAFGQPPGKSG